MAHQESSHHQTPVCVQCHTPRAEFGSVVSTSVLDLHVCPKCGCPHPLLASENYFSAFRLTPRFETDLDSLEKDFYLICRALHPDRFGAATPEIRQLSGTRMGFLNQAYGTLKNPVSRRTYLLSLLLEGTNPDPQAGSDQLGHRPAQAVSQGPKSPELMDVVEAWFEIQDDLSEDPKNAMPVLGEFELKLSELILKLNQKIGTHEALFDQAALDLTMDTQSWRSRLSESTVQVLNDIAASVGGLSYLESLKKDVERIKCQYK